MNADVWQGRPCDELAWNAYRRVLAAEGKTAPTIYAYRNALEKLSAWLPAGTGLYDATAAHVSAWLAAGAASGWAKGSLATYSRRVRTWAAWAERAGYTDGNPMAALKPVKEDVTEIPLPPVEDVRAVAALVSKGRDFRSRRDWAIICLLCEPGTPRASEMAGLTVRAVDLRHDTLTLKGKGGLERTIALGAASCRAIELYLRARQGHAEAAGPWLFLGQRGPITRYGLREILADRCHQAGVPSIPPHHFRHLTAHAFMDEGGSVPDAMKLFGWRSPIMATRYGGAAAATRAVSHARQMSIGDKILTGKAS